MRKFSPVPRPARTAQGRGLTPKGYHAIGLKAAASEQQSLL